MKLSKTTYVKSYFLIEFSGRKWKRLRKKHPTIPLKSVVEFDDKESIPDFLRMINDPTVKLYLVFNNGSRLRIRCHYTKFMDIFRNLKRPVD